MKGVEPGVLIEEFDSPKAIVRADPRFQAAMKRRGIADLDGVQIDTWGAGLLAAEERASGLRLLRCIFYYRGTSSTNPYFRPGSKVLDRASFIEHAVWVTKYEPTEMNAAGYYVNQNDAAGGLPLWTADDAPIAGEDIVLWYTFGVTHNPRPEEWPVMPVHQTGFMLLPDGFFSKNPALDVPAERAPGK